MSGISTLCTAWSEYCGGAGGGLVLAVALVLVLVLMLVVLLLLLLLLEVWWLRCDGGQL